MGGMKYDTDVTKDEFLLKDRKLSENQNVFYLLFVIIIYSFHLKYQHLKYL